MELLTSMKRVFGTNKKAPQKSKQKQVDIPLSILASYGARVVTI